MCTRHQARLSFSPRFARNKKKAYGRRVYCINKIGCPIPRRVVYTDCRRFEESRASEQKPDYRLRDNERGMEGCTPANMTPTVKLRFTTDVVMRWTHPACLQESKQAMRLP